STFSSQFLDPATVLLLLCTWGEIGWDLFPGLFFSGFIFKVLVAALDTPLLYLATYLFRKRFNLKFGEELKLDY
ncbi:MAG: VUT family protein, partial [Flavobacteriaceae bacterium]|nr:VUT family protein [Flavobacteriaceae bacterium]